MCSAIVYCFVMCTLGDVKRQNCQGLSGGISSKYLYAIHHLYPYSGLFVGINYHSSMMNDKCIICLKLDVATTLSLNMLIDKKQKSSPRRVIRNHTSSLVCTGFQYTLNKISK